MKGLKKYTHDDRTAVIKEMVPLIKKKFGDNLIAIAALASYARNEDMDYSDLELVAYLKDIPGKTKWGGMSKIRDGLLVELEWITKEYQINNIYEVNREWYISGSDVQVPITNEKYINEITAYKVGNLKEKCLKQVLRRWNEVQESAAKVLNAIVQKNREGISLLVFDMFHQFLIILSFLNQIPYITYSKIIAQAKQFKIKPASFDKLIDIMENGKYPDLENLDKIVRSVFAEFEIILEQSGIDPYYDNVDPSLPMKGYE